MFGNEVTQLYVSEYNGLCYKMIASYNARSAPEVVLLRGASGTGKTAFLRLLHKNMAECACNCTYVEAASFARKFAFLLQKGNISAWRRKLRSSQVLLVDDILALRGKKKSSEEMFHTLKDVLANGGRVVLSARDPDFSSEALGSLFVSNLRRAVNICIKEPSAEEKKQFFLYYCRQKPQAAQLQALPDFAAVQAWQDFNLKEIVALADCFLTGQVFNKHDLSQDYREILQKIDPALRHEDIIGKSKKKAIVEARRLLCAQLHTQKGYTFQEIALFLGNSPNCIRQRCEKSDKSGGR